MEVVKGKALEVGTRRGFEVILFISSDSWSDLLKSLIRIEERESWHDLWREKLEAFRRV